MRSGKPFPYDVPLVTVPLWEADALVLFDWLRDVDLDTVPVTHPAQKQALADLYARLESDTEKDFTGATAEEITAAQAEVAQNMGW
ncbi:hypothetical protein [Streptomyces sp. NPDC046909]|uniref:hypothetical protein n=1 Tax=Streptomyces sp. NPDC046909 TaxID=3155617 RepID=UPI0033FC3A4F